MITTTTTTTNNDTTTTTTTTTITTTTSTTPGQVRSAKCEPLSQVVEGMRFTFHHSTVSKQ